ncbi:MAG: DUF721 domain-containing protein [Flammeovirgaceae bacterium]|nr:DUF721 domain-containing protein [Flammeovirgaceae bacterium]
MRNKKNDGAGDAIHIRDAIQQLLKTYHIKPKFDEASLIASWDKLAGKAIAKRTRRLFIRDSVLFIELDSPGMKHDLNLHKEQIMDLFAQEFGTSIVKEIVVM